MKTKRPTNDIAMRLKQIFLLVLVLAFAGTAHAADVLRVQDVEVVPGESVTLNIELANETTNLMGWQCDIVLPDGLSLALKANGKPAATLGDRFDTTGHSISSSRLASGAYRFIATSMDGEAIPGNGGTLFTVTLLAESELQSLEASPTMLMQSLEASPTTLMQSLEASPTMLMQSLEASPTMLPQSLEASPTTLAGTVTNIEFNTQDNQKLILNDVSFTVTITLPELPKCATPTIAYDHGELVLACETEGVTFVSEVTTGSAKGGEGERVSLAPPTYTITVVAKKEGYDDSDAATAIIYWGEGRPVFTGFTSVAIDTKGASDVNGDGTVDVADIATIISTMAARARKQNVVD